MVKKPSKQKTVKTIVFTLGGQPLVSLKSGATVVTKAIEFLNKAPNGMLYRELELATKIGYSSRTLRSDFYRGNAEELVKLEKYSLLIKTKQGHVTRVVRVYGNKRTIAELAKHKEVLA